jgi:hypothetical protein
MRAQGERTPARPRDPEREAGDPAGAQARSNRRVPAGATRTRTRRASVRRVPEQRGTEVSPRLLDQEGELTETVSSTSIHWVAIGERQSRSHHSRVSVLQAPFAFRPSFGIGPCGPSAGSSVWRGSRLRRRVCVGWFGGGPGIYSTPWRRGSPSRTGRERPTSAVRRSSPTGPSPPPTRGYWAGDVGNERRDLLARYSRL